jgi:uncharacterized protein YcbX
MGDLSVSSICIAPVKALGIQYAVEVALERHGVSENRRFYLVDEEGALVTARRAGSLMQVEARYDAGTRLLALRFPSGEIVRETVAHAGEVETDVWSRNVGGLICRGPWSAALSTYLGREVRLVEAASPEGVSDFAALTLVSRASLAELARRGDDERLRDPRRFRMLFTIAGCGAHEEDGWAGSSMRIGEATIKMLGPVPRCAVTTLAPDTGRRDLDTLRAIKDYRGLGRGRAIREGEEAGPGDSIDFGVYAEVQVPGRVRVGDPVERRPA